MSKFRARLLAAAGIAAVSVMGMATPAFAHEPREVGPFHVEVGWKNEPTYTNVQNAVDFFLNDANDKPITDLGDTLKVEVIFGSQKSDPMPFEAAGDAGTPGEYLATLTPTRPGVYMFHLTGTIHGQAFDQTFTSSDKTFDSPKDATEVEFPVKDPTNAELATKLDRTSTRLNAVNASAAKAAKKAKDDASMLAIIGIVVGAVGLVVGGIGMARGRRTT
ncbi:MAG TPA: hypothetical protein VFA83_22995 [Acidimicrobiales bacterium]|nr:hypothetical protein [Acidimicrobiales bacterium]